MRLAVLRVFVLFCVFVFYRPFCHVPLNLTYLHCLQHSFFEHLNLYLKMLGLYLVDIISHKSCNMLSILNKFALPKELLNCVTNNVFWTIQLHLGAFAPKADALPLHHESTEKIDFSQAI